MHALHEYKLALSACMVHAQACMHPCMSMNGGCMSMNGACMGMNGACMSMNGACMSACMNMQLSASLYALYHVSDRACNLLCNHAC